ncbi:alpha/beta hydrolase [Roseibium aggregatum]|nr:alpha/beta fold hydrolase [Roseibium aggregatum]
MAEDELSLEGPQGLLKGAYVEAADNRAVVLIIPGSGPTDRDGNGGNGLHANSYRLLAEGLAEKGVSSLRIDKRGMFASAAAISDGNKVTVEDYAEDVRRWAEKLSSRSGHECIWLLGHSEGGLVALKSVETGGAPVCGLVLTATPGRPIGALMREQFKANPGTAPLLPDLNRILATLEKGETVAQEDIPPGLRWLFSPGLQAYMINLFSHDPARLMASYAGPSLILQGTGDIQVKVSDARLLKEAAANATLTVVEGMSHMLKTVPGEGPDSAMETYTNPRLPLSEAVVPAIADFVLRPRNR